jgi:hypothetical protein
MTDDTVQVDTPEKIEPHSEEAQTANDSLPVEKDATTSKRDRRAERRISKLTAKNSELSDDNAKLRNQFDELSGKVDALTPKPVRPQREDFEDLEVYEDAVMDYRIDMWSAGPSAPAKPKEPEQAIDPDLAKRFDGFIATSEKVTPGFEKVVANAHFPLTDHSLGDIMDMGSDGAELFTHLNANPIEAMRISQLSPRDQTIELEKIADSLDETSQAPDPITPVDGSDSPAVDESKLSVTEWINRRNKKLYG